MHTYFGREGVERDSEAREWRRQQMHEQRAGALYTERYGRDDQHGPAVQVNGIPVLTSHPNCRSTTVPQGQDDSTPSGADAARYAGMEYARFVEYGRSDGSPTAPALPDSPEGWLRPASFDLQVDASLDSVREATERAAEHLRDHSFDIEATITVPEDVAEDLRAEMDRE